MVGNTHRDNCAHAKNPGCECTGCGGSLHSWKGWTSLAADSPQARTDRRWELERGLQSDRRTGRLSPNGQNRKLSVNLFRLDIADHLWSTGPVPGPDGRITQPPDVTADPDTSHDLGRVTVVAGWLLELAWGEISPAIDTAAADAQMAKAAKRQLCDHAWCRLLIFLAQRIAKLNAALDVLSDAARDLFRRMLVDHVLTSLPRIVANAVAGIFVDRVWAALSRLLETHVLVIGDDLLRVLRVLAVFTCPSVEEHPEVYEHAVRPLMADARTIISAEVRTQVSVLFDTWWSRRSTDLAA